MALIAWFLVRSAGTPGPGGVPGYEPRAVNAELADMLGSDGRVHLPVRTSGESLENSAFAAMIARASGVDWDAKWDWEPASEAGGEVWDAYYRSLYRAAPTEPARGWHVHVLKEGGYAEPPAETRKADRPYVVLTTWAAVTAGAPLDQQTKQMLRSVVAECAEKEFVLAHAVLALETAAQPDEAARASLRRCLEVRGTAQAPNPLPQNEEVLLDLVGRAQALALNGEEHPAVRAALRTALKPTDWSWTDPWWAAYSLSGYQAAGGQASDYRGVAETLVGLSTNGAVPTISAQPPTLQADLFATLAAQSAAGSWQGLDTGNVAKLRPEGEGSDDTDQVMWALLARATGTQLDEQTAHAAVVAARRCVAQPINVGNVRTQGFCREALARHGEETSTVAVPTDVEQAEVVIEGTVLGIFAPTEAEKARALTTLSSRLDEAPTHSIAQALLLRGVDPANEDAADERALAEALAGRRVVGSHLYGSVKGSDVIDLYATYWVTRAQAQPHR